MLHDQKAWSFVTNRVQMLHKMVSESVLGLTDVEEVTSGAADTVDQKAWMLQEIHSPPKSRSEAFSQVTLSYAGNLGSVKRDHLPNSLGCTCTHGHHRRHLMGLLQGEPMESNQPGWSSQPCMNQLVGVFADIFNLSLLRSEILTCFKEIMIIPVPKKNQIACLNGYRLVALTSIIMKDFESGAEVELVKSFKFREVNITNDLLCSIQVDATANKAHQHLYFFRRLRKFNMSTMTLTAFYRCTIENILSASITVWY
eukprot:g37190.t1